MQFDRKTDDMGRLIKGSVLEGKITSPINLFPVLRARFSIGLSAIKQENPINILYIPLGIKRVEDAHEVRVVLDKSILDILHYSGHHITSTAGMNVELMDRYGAF